MKRALASLAAAAMLMLVAASAHAKISDAVWSAVTAAYPPAVWNDGLATAYVDPDPSKFRGYVVVETGGIAAERAKRFITWAEYDYRGVTVDIAKETVKNRRGETYTYLQSGDIMAVARLDRLGNTVYLYLISPDVYHPAAHTADKHFSRVTTAVKFNLPRDMAENDDPAAALAALAAWLKPCTSLDDARVYARSLGATPEAKAPPAADTHLDRPTAVKEPQTKPPGTSPGMPPELPFTEPDDGR